MVNGSINHLWSPKIIYTMVKPCFTGSYVYPRELVVYTHDRLREHGWQLCMYVDIGDVCVCVASSILVGYMSGIWFRIWNCWCITPTLTLMMIFIEEMPLMLVYTWPDTTNSPPTGNWGTGDASLTGSPSTWTHHPPSCSKQLTVEWTVTTRICKQDAYSQ